MISHGDIQMKRYQRIALVAGIVLFGGAVLAASKVRTQVASCVTEQQVIEHMDRSRNGISLTCNETVRQRALATGVRDQRVGQ